MENKRRCGYIYYGYNCFNQLEVKKKKKKKIQGTFNVKDRNKNKCAYNTTA